MLKTTNLLPSLVTMLLCLGCTVDPAGTPDPSADNKGDTAGPDNPFLIGDWESFDYPFTYTWTFNDDGTFASDEHDSSFSFESLGTYEVVGDRLVLDRHVSSSDPTIASRRRWTYHAGPDFFSPMAFLPVGARTGIVGIWRGTDHIDYLDAGGAVTATYDDTDEIEFRADGTATRTMTTVYSAGPVEPPKVFDGHYEETSPGVFKLDVMRLPFRILDGDAAIDHQVFQRR